MSGAAPAFRDDPRNTLILKDRDPGPRTGMAVAAQSRSCELPMNTSSSQWSQAVLVHAPPMQASEVRMVLVTGSELLAVQEAALTLFDAGHIPLVAEWFVAPMASQPACGVKSDEILEALAARLLTRVDAVLRLAGPAPASDVIVRMARSQGLRVFSNIEDVLAG